MLTSSKYKCGQIIASSCVPFSGKGLTFLSEVETENFPCDANINDVFYYIDKYIKILKDNNDFSDFEVDCIDFDPATVTSKDLHKLELENICVLKGQVKTLNDYVADFNIGNEHITINLGCLTPEMAECTVATNVYTLQSILQLFASKICDFEQRLETLES